MALQPAGPLSDSKNVQVSRMEETSIVLCEDAQELFTDLSELLTELAKKGNIVNGLLPHVLFPDQYDDADARR